MDAGGLIVFDVPVGIVAVAFEAECELVVMVALHVEVALHVLAKHETELDLAPRGIVLIAGFIVTYDLHVGAVGLAVLGFLVRPHAVCSFTGMIAGSRMIHHAVTVAVLIFQVAVTLYILIEREAIGLLVVELDLFAIQPLIAV